MTDTIKGKVVAITGASSGIGEATARLLAQAGARVVLGARRLDRLEMIVREIQASGGEALACRLDVVRRADSQTFVKTAVDSFGCIDVLINNAGVMLVDPLTDLKVDDWDRMVDVNIKGLLYGVAAALPVMIAQGRGHIINVSSVAGHKVAPGFTVYCGTKYAVRAITEGLRQEVGANIRATIISPGGVATELPSHISNESRDGVEAMYVTAIHGSRRPGARRRVVAAPGCEVMVMRGRAMDNWLRVTGSTPRRRRGPRRLDRRVGRIRPDAGTQTGAVLVCDGLAAAVDLGRGRAIAQRLKPGGGQRVRVRIGGRSPASTAAAAPPVGSRRGRRASGSHRPAGHGPSVPASWLSTVAQRRASRSRSVATRSG